MKRLLSLTLRCAVVAMCSLTTFANAQAQGAAIAATPEIAKLSLPVYPPLARMARIVGDVKILVGVRQDGSVASAEVVSGHPMLKQAALESAQKSTFLCLGCKDAVTPFTVTYTFGMRDDLDGFDCSATRLRAAKCLGLWRCGGWRTAPPRKPAIGRSLDHVMILADPTCLET